MVVGRDRPHDVAAGLELVSADAADALEGAPAEVLGALVELERDAVDLLDLVLADVADPDLVHADVEGEAPRVAQAGEDGLPLRLRRVDRGGEQLAELRVRVLGGAAGVEGAAAVAEPEVQAPVGAEGELAAVVVLLRLVDVEELPARARIDGAVAAGAQLGDAGVALAVRPVQVDAPVAGEVRVEGDAQQPLLGTGEDLGREVEDRAAVTGGADAEDAAGLLEHPQRAVVAGGGADPGRAVEAGGDAADVEVVRAAALLGGLRGLQILQLVVARQRREAAHHERGKHDRAGGDEHEGTTHGARA